MPKRLICCVSLPPATRLCVPIYDFAVANEELAAEDMETYYACCGMEICKGCIYSFCQSGNDDKCPFCNSDRASTPHEEQVNDIRKRVAANDPTSICMLAGFHQDGRASLQQDQAKAIELFIKSAELVRVRRIVVWVASIMKGGILRRPSSTLRPRLWQEAKRQGATLELWRQIRKHGACCETLEYCCICWVLSCHVSFDFMLQKRCCQ